MYLSIFGPNADPEALATLQGELADFPGGPRWERISLSEQSSATAQHVLDRVTDDFLWQRDPFKRAVLGGATNLEYPGLDTFVPYWMAREAGAIPVPSSGPPVPEPSSFILMGVVGVLLLSRTVGRRVASGAWTTTKALRQR